MLLLNYFVINDKYEEVRFMRCVFISFCCLSMASNALAGFVRHQKKKYDINSDFYVYVFLAKNYISFFGKLFSLVEYLLAPPKRDPKEKARRRALKEARRRKKLERRQRRKRKKRGEKNDGGPKKNDKSGDNLLLLETENQEGVTHEAEAADAQDAAEADYDYTANDDVGVDIVHALYNTPTD